MVSCKLVRPQTQPRPRPRPNNGQKCSVTLYEHCNYGGFSKTYRKSEWWVGHRHNEKWSSAKVGSGCDRVTLYEHVNFQGAKMGEFLTIS